MVFNLIMQTKDFLKVAHCWKFSTVNQDLKLRKVWIFVLLFCLLSFLKISLFYRTSSPFGAAARFSLQKQRKNSMQTQAVQGKGTSDHLMPLGDWFSFFSFLFLSFLFFTFYDIGACMLKMIT